MKFGTLVSVLGEPLTTVFDTAARLGFDGVELDWSAVEDARGDGCFGPAQRGVLKERAKRAGVEIPSVCAHFLNRGGLGSSDKAVQQAGLEAVRAGIGLCADLGARVLLVPFFGSVELEEGAATWQLARHLKSLRARRKGGACGWDREHAAGAGSRGARGPGRLAVRGKLLGYGQCDVARLR